MIFSYTVTFADFKAANRLYRSLRLTRRLNFALWFIILPLLAIAGSILFLVFDMSKLTEYAAILFGIECGLSVLSGYSIFCYFYKTRQAYKQVFTDSGKERIIELEVAEESVRTLVPGVSEGKYFWNQNIDVAHDEQALILVMAKGRFTTIPTRYLTQAQIDEIQAIVNRNKVKK